MELRGKQVGVVLDCEPLMGPNTTFWKITKNEKIVGKITSAIYSPRLKKNIALAMVSIEQSHLGTLLDVEMLSKRLRQLLLKNLSTILKKN